MQSASPNDTTRANSFTTGSALTILSTGIRQDAEGRYCLNDCHRAAGGDKAKQPANFLRLDATQALALEIYHSSDVRSDPIEVLNGGTNPGTYVARELVYAYAMWISPSFHLTVIRAFDAMVQNPPPARPTPTLPPEAFALYRELTDLGMSAHAMTRKRAVTFANEAVHEKYGVDIMGLMGLPKARLSAPARATRPATDLSEVVAALACAIGVGKFPRSTSQIIELALVDPDLAAAFKHEVIGPVGTICPRRLGFYLARNAGKDAGGLFITDCGLSREKSRLWAIDRFATEFL